MCFYLRVQSLSFILIETEPVKTASVKLSKNRANTKPYLYFVGTQANAVNWSGDVPYDLVVASFREEAKSIRHIMPGIDI